MPYWKVTDRRGKQLIFENLLDLLEYQRKQKELEKNEMAYIDSMWENKI